jgi:hypothetical protein
MLLGVYRRIRRCIPKFWSSDGANSETMLIGYFGRFGMKTPCPENGVTAL